MAPMNPAAKLSPAGFGMGMNLIQWLSEKTRKMSPRRILAAIKRCFMGQGRVRQTNVLGYFWFVKINCIPQQFAPCKSDSLFPSVCF
jgi:hypothetical protein